MTHAIQYWLEEMNRAARLGSDNPRTRTIGFALTRQLPVL